MSGMTDARALEILSPHNLGNFNEHEMQKAVTHIAARLRDEQGDKSRMQAEQQAVAWIKPDWQNPKNFDGTSPVSTYPQPEWVPLYTRPQAALSSTASPAPVAGDAVTALRDAESGIAAIFESGDWGMADDTIVQGLNVLEDIRAALAQDHINNQ